MNDRMYLRDQTNHWFANIAVLLIIVVAFIMSITSVPLTIITGG